MKFVTKKYVDILNDPDGYMNSQAHKRYGTKAFSEPSAMRGHLRAISPSFHAGEKQRQPKTNRLYVAEVVSSSTGSLKDWMLGLCLLYHNRQRGNEGIEERKH